jgi:hypothetical protein
VPRNPADFPDEVWVATYDKLIAGTVESLAKFMTTGGRAVTV